ncbi:MAG: tetratricopeptide repeat protein [Planctomycetaceae bacterium]|nr:tetratricopeptide repeat protein [Planctomycetaceae bacterium]
MNPRPIQLRYSHEQQRVECARFVEGSDSTAWLEAMAVWGVSLVDAQLLVVPRSANDLTPLGVLVVLRRRVESRELRVKSTEETALSRNPQLSTLNPQPSPVRSQPYGLVGEKLYVPVEAAFSPPVADKEWADLLSGDMAAYVWHPVVGLIGFEADDVRRVSDLIEPPTISDDDWSRAEPGVTVNTRLWSVSGPELPSADEVLGTGKGTIGTQADKMGQLLSGPMEKVGQGMRAAVGAAMLPFAMAASKLASMMPKGKAGHAASGGQTGAQASGGIGDGWAARMLKKTADLLSARNRQIDKLLDMLHSNPDEGLKFAIPFGGQFGGMFRGLAIPGFSLLSRLVDFSLGGMGGGGPSDIWDIDYDRQQRLINRYRELAEREIRLGRYRRAAYIYATLLNDLPSAAAVLEKGKQYREAAVVYKEKLNRPWDAVRCLENGGMFDEAVKLYEELEEFEKIGDLYVRLEQPDEAEQAYQRAVEKFIAKDDYLAAAKLQEQKLEDVDAALVSLDAGWPRSGQARACLDESFRMLGRLGRHEAAHQRVTSLSRQTLRDDRMSMLVDGLVEAAVGYPDDNVQTFAADIARVTTSRVLKRRRVHSKPLLDALRRLAPDDRLLDRDCHRYEHANKLARIRKPLPVQSGSRGVVSFIPEKVNSLHLEGGDLQVCRLTQRAAYVAGYHKNRLLLYRKDWSPTGRPSTRVFWRMDSWTQLPILLAVDGRGNIHIGLVDGSPLEPQSLLPQERSVQAAVAQTPACVGAYLTGLCTSPTDQIWCTNYPPTKLQGFTHDGTPLRTVSLPPVEDPGADIQHPYGPLPIHARDDGVVVGVNRSLFVLTKEHSEIIDEMQSRITEIVPAFPHSLKRVVVLGRGEGLMTWRLLEQGPTETFHFDHDSAAATFMRDGRLVVLGDAGMSIYSTENEELKLLAESSYAIPDALGACQFPGTRHVAVCRKSGVIDVLALPDLRGG